MVDNKYLNQCPVELAMNLINKKWVILLIRDMFFGKSHFNEFKEGKPDLSNKVLSNCLKDIEKNGLIERVVNPENSLDIEYRLTEDGLRLNKIIFELAMYTLNTPSLYNKYYDDKTREELKVQFKKHLNIK